MRSVHALIELQNRSVGILEQTSQDLSARLFAVCDRVGGIGLHEDLDPGSFELLHSILEIVNPEGEVMNPDLVKAERLARRIPSKGLGEHDEACVLRPSHI